ncbi:MAG: hypothetical protein P4L73_07410 [Caulobacteraceae bacterium]|nr:hypothetical protein [Caulobacteraceae bacterium]
MRVLGPNVFASPEQIVRKSLSLSSADRHGSVSVAGPDSLEAMVSLCRDGFDHVECARQATSACADEASDLLLITGPMSLEDLSAVLHRTCRLLRDGGVLVVQLRYPRDDEAVRAALDATGMRIASTLFDLSAGCLVSHTVERAVALRKAS